MTKHIVLPSGARVTLKSYCAAWREVLRVDADREFNDFGAFPMTAGEILSEIRNGIHDRINRHLSYFGKGRKWGENYQTETLRASRALNTPRLAIHWLPLWLRERFEHRISTQ